MAVVDEAHSAVTKSQRAVALDGIRAIAIIFVIVSHFVDRSHLDHRDRVLLSPVDDGLLGVELFFALSGYLITTLLLRERARSGRIELGHFLVRRALRIWPAFFVFVAVLAVLGASGALAVTSGQLALAGSFLYDFNPFATNDLAHTWSLALEMQFYLFWPLLVVKLSTRRLMQIALAVVVVAPFVRVAVYALMPAGDRSVITTLPLTRLDALMVGCLLALLPLRHPVLHLRLQSRAVRPTVVVGCTVVLLVSGAIGRLVGGAWQLPIGWTVESLAIAVLLLAALAPQTNLVRRLATHRVMVTVGVLSYSIYLWQQPIIFGAPRGTPLHDPVVALGAILLVAFASYRLVERPALRLKRRFTPI